MTRGVPADAPPHDLTVRRTFACPREEVFEAWTDPDALATWFGGGLARTLSASVDLRVGGTYRLTMRSGAQVFALEGVYQEVEPPERLVYTWRWDGLDVDAGRQSLVRVEFRDRDGATEVVVTHEDLDTTTSLAFHDGGWMASLERLGQVLAPAARTGAVPVLWHIKVSNFNEKARWALDYKRVPHRRRDPMPGTHMAIALALTRRVATFPVLQIDGKAIGDSTRIIATLEQRFPDPPLYPADPTGRRRALELEEFFDEHLGPHVRRVGFWELLRDAEFMRSRAADMTTPRQGRVLAAALPVFSAMLRSRYGITEASAAQSLLKLRSAMRSIEDALDGRDHLVGDQFTVADLTAAALLAPLLGPPQLPYRNPSTALPPSFERLAADLRSQPAGAWALRTYERHRPSSAEIDG